MSHKEQDKMRIIRQYKLEKQVEEVDMREVAKYAVERGWLTLPEPLDPFDMLGKKFSEAARNETRNDKETKRPYRAYMPITFRSGDKQTTLWIDTDSTTRPRMEKAVSRYRDGMVGVAVMGTNTVDHWNRVNPEQIPLTFDTDLTEEVSWRLNGEGNDEEDQEAA